MVLILARIYQDVMKYDKINSEYYGTIGVETHIKDVDRNRLCIGDIVEIASNTSGRKDLKPVVEHNGQVFVMGLYSVNQEALISEWKIKRVKSYKELSVGFTGVDDFYIVEGKGRSTDIKGALLDKDFNLNTIREKLLDFVTKHSEYCQ